MERQVAIISELKNIPRVYDQNMELLGTLDKAKNISYKLELNKLWYGSFTMPANDFKNSYLQAFNYVEIYDNEERVELFRITNNDLTRRNTTGIIKYQCEHVLATLIDTTLFKYHQVGNKGVYTEEVIRYILDKQNYKDWVLGGCDFRRQFEYKFENTTLLKALFSVPNCFKESYRFEYDTTSYPWRISLKKMPTEFKADIRYQKNMKEVIKTTDPTNIVTRLYALGYGEGDNQLTIESVNNGIPYLEADTVTTWRIRENILVDRRFENPETLKAYAETILEEVKNPYISYSVTAIDLYRLNPNVYEEFFPGDIVRIIDKEDDIQVDLPIISVSKENLTGDSGKIDIVVGNKTKDITGSMAELQERSKINDLYSQGAGSQSYIVFMDNADPEHPAKFPFYISSDTSRINKLILYHELEPFRGNTRTIKSAAQKIQSTTIAPQETRSTTTQQQRVESTTIAQSRVESTTVAPAKAESTTVEQQKVQSTTTEQQRVSSTSVESAVYRSTELSGEIVRTSDNPSSWEYGSPSQVLGEMAIGDVIGSSSVGNHGHKFNMRHNHNVEFPSHEHYFEVPAHAHIVTIPAHSHTVVIPAHSHTVTIPAHAHTVTIPAHSHTVTIPAHSHTVTIPSHSHIVIIPEHSHDIEFGIFEGTTASKVTLRIDGVTVEGNIEDIDIIKYLSKDSSGKIKRDAWHKVELVPDRNTRVVGVLFLQTFTNSRGGGDY